MGPAAIGVEVDRAPFVDKAPANDMGLFSVAAGGQSFRVTWHGAGLSHLVEVGHERQQVAPFAGDVDHGLAAAQRGLRVLECSKDDLLCLGDARLALLFGQLDAREGLPVRGDAGCFLRYFAAPGESR